MPQNSSAWVDLRIHLIVVIGLLLVILFYNVYVAAIGFVVLLSLFIYGRERCKSRQRELEEYCQSVVKNINELSNYAVENLPLAILLVSRDGRIKWGNDELARWIGAKPTVGMEVRSFWNKIIIEPIWGKDGSYVFSQEEKFYHVKHRRIFTVDDEQGLMVLYVTDVTELERLKQENTLKKTVLSYIQIDNYDEVLQGLSEAQRTAITVDVNRLLDEWVNGIGAFLRRVSEETYIAVLDRGALDKALHEKFEVLDKVRAIHGANKYPVTLSLGIAAGGDVTMAELGAQAQAGLDLALGRGGDQVAVQMDGKTQFYGGKAKAVEKHTRVKARVVAHALNEIIANSDLVLVMGHHNEDFDSLGSAMGVARMARQLRKEVHIVLSEMNEGIDKFTELIKSEPEYADIFIGEKELGFLNAHNSTLFVVDTHIPNLTAAPALLERIERVIVIDHHRRSESFIQNPFLIYIEPASSSTSELVTELLMYFSNHLTLSRLDATSLYAGMVVDTKNFAVQTGVRTFDAAAYLRRSGADPAMVRQLFRSDYETSMAKAKAFSTSEFLAGGILVAICPPDTTNGQIIAAQIADSMLRIEDVRMSLVLFYLDGGGVGISARSTGEINVQMIMEQFGGGGHQNVAGAQVKNAEIEEVKSRAIELSMKYLKESDENESNIAGRG